VLCRKKKLARILVRLMQRRRRRRRGRRGRPPIDLERIGPAPKADRMEPSPLVASEPLFLDHAEAEVLRLVDLEGLYQEDAGAEMGLSRGTVWRLLASARQKVIRAIFEGRPLVIGHVDEDKYESP
jgi:predicted DNA-binding protein (UPF0251 family)